jgi:AMP nucleosidase
VHTRTVARADSRLSYGFVHGPGVYETTLTRPDLYSHYYLEQFRLLLKNHGTTLEVGTSAQPIPVHFSFAENDHVEGNLSAERRQLMRDVFDLPDLSVMDDGIANGTYEPRRRPPAAVAVHRPARRLLAAPPAPLHRHPARVVPELRAVHQLPVLHRRIRAHGP